MKSISEYKTGDKVKILDHVPKNCGLDGCTGWSTNKLEMNQYIGKVITIEKIIIDNKPAVTSTETGKWVWGACMIEPYTEENSIEPKAKKISIKKIKLLPDEVQIGHLTFKINQKIDCLIPKSCISIKIKPDDTKALAIALKNNLPALLIGETGTGKTSIVRELAYKLHQPYVRVNMTGYTTPDELIGSKSVKNGRTYFEAGIITDAMARGAILVLDEINATTPDCMFILHGLLDDDKRITLPNGEVITPHKNFRVFATCNPDYEGTKTMNKALIDRFPIILSIETLAPAEEKKLLISRTDIDTDTADKLVTIATTGRVEYTNAKIGTFISTRSLLNVSQLINSGLSPREAYTTTVCRKTTNVTEQKILLDLFLSVFKMADGDNDNDTPTVITKGELKKLEGEVNRCTKNINELQSKIDQTVKDKDAVTEENKNLFNKLEDSRNEVQTLNRDIKEKTDKLLALETLEKMLKTMGGDYANSHP